MVLPPHNVLVVMLAIGGGIVTLLLAVGIIFGLLLWLAGLIFTPRQSKPEIIPDGLIIFDV